MRNVSLGHVRALEVPATGGQRFILSAGAFIWQDWFDVVNELKLQEVTVPAGTPGAGKSFNPITGTTTRRRERCSGLSSAIRRRRQRTGQHREPEGARVWMSQMSYSLCRFWAYDESQKIVGEGPNSPAWKLALTGSMAGGIAGFVGNPGEIIMVRLQGDFAKSPEKRLNYKNYFDGLYRMVHDEGPSSLARGVTPIVFRAILMNASQLALYDYVKAELLKTPYFNDNIYCHFTAS
ncbi:mitochondrial carrier domain-containing protein [Phellopilus nigrolimitatus]|nr:mitochondrial carrier domain-containing protein [Phellopilus nigrolimitatus]